MPESELFLRGTQQLRAGQFDDAKKTFKENEEKAGTTHQTLGLLHQAELKLTQGDLPGAAGLLSTVLDRNPGLPEAYLGLARLALASGQLDEAKVHATAATRLAPQLGLGWTLLGLAAESQGDADGALPLLAKGATLSPDVYLCQLNLGRFLASIGRAPEGLGALTRATELEPGNADGFGLLGLAQHKAGQHLLALRALERAKELDRKNVDRWATLADLLFEVREFKAVADLLDHGLASCGEHPALLEKAVAAAMMLEDAPRAIAYLERELVVVPDHEQGWLNLASLYLTTKDFDRAEATTRTLLEKNPKRWEAWYLLGNLYGAVPVEAQAEAAYRRAIELSQGDFRPVMNLATLFIESSSPQRHAEAVPLLEQALGRAPKGEWRVHYNLALAFTRLRQTDRALELAREIQREADPDEPMVAEAKKLESNLLEGRR